MFKWIERKILRPIIKDPKKLLAIGAAAGLGPAAAAVLGKVSLGTATKTALLSGAANVAGAMLTRADAKKENNRVLAANKLEAQRVQEINQQAVDEAQAENTGIRENYYKNLVQDAQAAGINPLTAIRTGGGSGYGAAVAATMNNAVLMEGVYASPTLSRNPIAAGIEGATNVYLGELTRQKQYDHETRMDELNESLIKAQIQSMTANLSLNDKDEKGRSKLNIFGFPMDPADIDDAEKAEERYGDLMSWIYGGAVVAADAINNAPVLGRHIWKKTDGMPPMDTRGFGNPFGSTLVSKGLNDRWQQTVNDALK